MKICNSKSFSELECKSNECLCVSDGGNTCGYAMNLACDPDECYERDGCPGYGYWCKDAGPEGIAKLM